MPRGFDLEGFLKQFQGVQRLPHRYQMDPNRRDAMDISMFLLEFDKLDEQGNHNGILEANEIRSSSILIADRLADWNRELMFARRELGKKPWLGLTKNDLKEVGRQLDSGKSLESFGRELREEYIRENQKAFDRNPGNELGYFDSSIDAKRAMIRMQEAVDGLRSNSRNREYW